MESETHPSGTSAQGRKFPLLMLRSLGSLQLAILLIAVYAAALVAGTAVEKLHGAAAAQRHVYHAGWFVALNMLLAVNVLAAMLARFPWRLRQAGFVATHLGLLVLLAGCLLSWCCGSRAILPIVEGRTAHRAYAEDNPDAPPVELGFQVRLRRFRRKLDPGSAMPSHYSSRVDFLDRGDPPNVLREGVEIKLNRPVDFTDPSNGRTYRLFQSGFDGPWFPGQAMFDHHADEKRDRGHVYMSKLSLNYDPGRLWKNLGSLLIIAGIVMVYYIRPGRRSANSRRPSDNSRGPSDNSRGLTAPGDNPSKNSIFRGLLAPGYLLLWIILPLLLVGLSAGEARSDDAERLDWGHWRRLPVFGVGRAEPLDTFARKAVVKICGRAEPLLAVEGGRPRRFTAPELLFAWLTEPEKWEDVPFLAAADPWLRGVLDLPLIDEAGQPLRFAAPAQLAANEGFARYWDSLQQRAESEGKDFQLTAEEERLVKLIDAYGLYRRLTFDSNSPKDMPWRFYQRKLSAEDAWRALIADGECMRRIKENTEVRDAMIENGKTLNNLRRKVQEQDFSRSNVESAVVEFRRSCEKLAALLSAPEDARLRALAAALTRHAAEMHLALFDNGDALRLLPALASGGLESNRLPSDDAPPWLSFQALIHGGELLEDYPPAELEQVRKAYGDAAAAHQDRGAADRTERFSAATRRFAESLRRLAERIEPARRALPLLERDDSLLDATAYPPQAKIDAEVFYNRLDSFLWAWIAGLAAAVCLAAAVGRLRGPAFWTGAAAMAVSLAFVLAGLGLRAYITGLAPLTGMFESVVVVAAFVFLMGLWLALLPLFGLDDSPGRVERVYQRRLFALSGAVVGGLAMVLAYFAPTAVMRREIGSAAPILRDNFWLVVHVVTIMAGYASAAIALILGNISLGYYLFGRYPEDAGGRRPPAACAALAEFIYTAVKITVLLLTAGTILGAFWADKSWGRFWGWDPKEVWALISLLVYLWFLHARHIRWSGDFGMAATAILGAIVILFNWYGVNFILGTGLHAYASGAGGQLPVTAAVALQWLFLLAAAVRYLLNRNGGLPSPQADVQ